MKKGFTLIELVVAIALLSMVLGFSGVIFKTSIEAHRTAGANSEIMQKLRAITDQLNSDFKGLQKDAPLLIWFQQDTGVAEPNRYDQIMFFANGDFQTVRYPVPVSGNVARVYYGQAVVNRDIIVNFVPPWLEDDKEKRILGRRQHILTADLDLDSWPDISSFVGSFIPLANDWYEHGRISLADWIVISNDLSCNDQIINTCFNNRPSIDLQNSTNLHMLMSEGVSSFQIQWAYYWPVPGQEGYRWWPSVDPDGKSTYISHFDLNVANLFGIYFNLPASTTNSDWHPVELAKHEPDINFPAGTFPKALKFTFTLYDSKGIIKNGRTFTHIVYLD